MENPKYYQIDYAKAIGILLVIIGHVIFHQENPELYLANISTFIYSFHIPLFFILSGLVTGLKFQSNIEKKTKKDELFKLFKRLFIPYIIWSLIYIFFTFIFIVSNSPDSLSNVIFEKLYSTICLHGISPLWFLSNLFITLVIFYSFLFLKFQNTYNIPCHIIAIIITFILSLYINQIFNPYPFKMKILYLYPIIAISRIVTSLFFIEIGYLLSKIWKKYLNLNFNLRLICFFIILILIILLKDIFFYRNFLYIFLIQDMKSFFITGILGSLFIISFSCLLEKEICFFSDIGKNTLNIMALHYPPIPINAFLVFVFSLLGFDLFVIIYQLYYIK